jgi:hypothetical protein
MVAGAHAATPAGPGRPRVVRICQLPTTIGCVTQRDAAKIRVPTSQDRRFKLHPLHNMQRAVA